MKLFIFIVVLLNIIHYCIKKKIQKITNFIDITSDNLPRFVTKKWIEFYDLSEKSYNPNKEIRIKTSLLRSFYVIVLMPILL